MPPPSAPLHADIAAALDWWREAGVDAAFSDEPRGWLADPATPERPAEAPARDERAKPAPAPVAQIGGAQALWPQDLAAFREWWLSEPSLDEGGLTPRIAPSGEPGAALMVLVAMPEESDRDGLLSGAQGRLLDGFLAAAGLKPETVYRAAVLPRHTALPDWDALAQQGMGAVLARHVSLARPARLLILGRNILPLCGHDPAQQAPAVRFFNHEGGRVPALAEVGLERLLANAQSRARLWRRWLDWTDGTEWREGSG